MLVAVVALVTSVAAVAWPNTWLVELADCIAGAYFLATLSATTSPRFDDDFIALLPDFGAPAAAAAERSLAAFLLILASWLVASIS